MIIISKPAISSHLSSTLSQFQIPSLILKESIVPMKVGLNQVDESWVKKNALMLEEKPILTTFENGLDVYQRLLPSDPRIKAALIFKDKIKFREEIKDLFPEYFFKEFNLNEISVDQVSKINLPAILKPVSGISSIGVVPIYKKSDWASAIDYLKKELKTYKKNYSGSVVQGDRVVVESLVEGEEYAVDGYYNQNGETVLLNIFKHEFKDKKDTSDLLYLTSRDVMQKTYKPIHDFCKQIGNKFRLRNFPFHLEVKIKNNFVFPIEINPMRFSGLGTTEISQYSTRINVYDSFFNQKKPNWDEILNRKDESVYYFSCLDVPTPVFRKKTLKISDREIFNELGEVLEYRILSEKMTSTFAVVFVRTDSIQKARKVFNLKLFKFMKV